MNVVVLRRRLFYICAMVLLLVPLYFMGKPSVRNADGSVKERGGTLAQIRSAYDLGQGDLGEIDPASESMRLATLGLRGVAATILWQKAEYYKKEQYWDRLSATLNQIAILQPHFVEVWEFQSHNLAYNVSVEFDDYRQRYQWVKRGIDYLIKGSKFNKNRTEMPFEMGNLFGSKMGVADEKKQFRTLYRDDTNFHAEVQEKTGLDLNQPDGVGPDKKPDNWLSGHLWKQRAYDMVDAGAVAARSALMFYVKGPQFLMKSAEAMQTEGILDEPARFAWRRAGRGWETFGKRNILTTFGDTIYLRETAIAVENHAKLKKEFEEFAGETYAKLLAERTASLKPAEIAAWNKPELDRSLEEMLMAQHATNVFDVPPSDVARAMPEKQRIVALEKAKQLEDAKEKIRHIEIYANQVNYSYWDERCQSEQDDAAILARTSMYEANQLLDRAELDAAIAKFDEAWKAWDDLFNKYPAMMIDDAADEVKASIERYRRLLDQPDLPDDFALKDFVRFSEMREKNETDPAIMDVMTVWPKRYPDRDFLTELFKKVDTQSTPRTNTENPSDPGSEKPSEEPTPQAAAESVETPAARAPITPETPDATVPDDKAEANDDGDVDAESASDADVTGDIDVTGEIVSGEITVEAPESGAAPSPKK